MAKMGPGIEKDKIRRLKFEAFGFDAKMCVVLFDVMPVQIFQETVGGAGTSAQQPEHVPGYALVFMFQGVTQRMQHIVAHYIIKGSVEAMQIVETVREVVKAVLKTYHIVLAVVCKHTSLNVTAMDLLSETRDPSVSHSFKLCGRTIFIIYDVPQLYLSIRDQFRESGEIVINGRASKWSHLVELYGTKLKSFLGPDSDYSDLINPTGVLNKDVSLAVQLLSESTAGYLNILKPYNPRNLEAEKVINDSIMVIKNLDELFASTNEPGHKDQWQKGYKEWVTKDTYHHKKWEEFIKMLKSVRYPKMDADEEFKLRSERCINCYIKTLLSLQGICKYLNRKCVKSLSLRRLNQDKLQRIFRMIEKKYRTRQPTSEEFTNALKTIEKQIKSRQQNMWTLFFDLLES